MASELEIPMIEEDAAAAPAGAPPDFRERVVLALKTTDETVLKAAERDFRGVFVDVRDFLETEVGRDLPPHLGWLLACCSAEKLLAGYERGRVAVWTIPLPDGRVMIFESPAETGRVRAGRAGAAGFP